ncbi:hypothetical protein VTN77DRAFT_6812 [Rasamsonia byssochlamydoides]|uniref:uncharacterized protein n=1 Tax=Rasamsonia byssochlamydoides TaxID=89139 RepID=UPI0037433A40
MVGLTVIDCISHPIIIIMAPSNKSLSPAAKQQLILDHIRSTRTCHTLKDLEKVLPSVASINGMQVKEYMQALVDDSKVRMEKIGSVNWYWSFPSEEKREREQVKERLTRELERVQKTTEELEMELQARIAATQGADGDDEAAAEEEAAQREILMQRRDKLTAEVKRIRADEEALLAGGAAGVERKKEEIETWKREASMWTDNIYILEQYVTKLAGGDRDVVDAVKRECYGDEYEEGEGLKELCI